MSGLPNVAGGILPVGRAARSLRERAANMADNAIRELPGGFIYGRQSPFKVVTVVKLDALHIRIWDVDYGVCAINEDASLPAFSPLWDTFHDRGSCVAIALFGRDDHDVIPFFCG